MREEEKKRTSQKISFKQIFRKRWVLPAIYLATAAIILTGVLWLQNANNDSVDQTDIELGQSDVTGPTYGMNEPSIPVLEPVQNFVLPVLEESAVEIQKEFYDVNAPAEKQEAALVFYNNQYYPNKGIDIVAKDGQAFDVSAALGGTVIRAEQDPLFGYVVEVEHEEGIKTVYQSLAEIVVSTGETVEQGQVLGTSGESLYNEEAGLNVHFEIRKDGTPVNPLQYIGKPVSSLKADHAEPEDEETNATESEEPADDENGEGEDAGDNPDEENGEDTTNSPGASSGQVGA
ncbi:M23 family peptidase [Bacillus sp. HMF5848]|uniref:M23 family metallopeptidase n=1 Tax=Bacillus sp. HMF5848 TaxID=2495421 RepID=UPI000F784B7E|nr:M23 family metallopeptidase [Bacillus sp. HMF5848]RSK28920.1 M23 family peptidase [Bacillus sp. HMF5848]